MNEESKAYVKIEELRMRLVQKNEDNFLLRQSNAEMAKHLDNANTEIMRLVTAIKQLREGQDANEYQLKRDNAPW